MDEPVVIRFGDTSAPEWDVEAYGFMPSPEQYNRRGRASSEEKCSLAARMRVPLSRETIDIRVVGDEEKRDSLRLRIGDVETPDLSVLSSSSLGIAKAFIDAFFDTTIAAATRRESTADKIEASDIDPFDQRLQADPEIEFHDYIAERVRVNRAEAKRGKSSNQTKRYKQKRMDAEAQMLEIYRKQGLARDDNDTHHGTD